MAKKSPEKLYEEFRKNIADRGLESIYAHKSSGRKARNAFSAPDLVKDILILPLYDNPVMPYQDVMMDFDDKERQQILETAHMAHLAIALVYVAEDVPDSVKDMAIDDLEERYGVLGIVEQVSTLANGNMQALISTFGQGKVEHLQDSPECLIGDVRAVDIAGIPQDEKDDETVSAFLKELYDEAAGYLTDEGRQQLYSRLDSLPADSEKRFHTMVQNSPLDATASYKVLERTDYSSRRKCFIVELQKGVKLVEFRHQFSSMAMNELGQRQKDEFIRTQIRMLQDEIGEGESSEEGELFERAAKKNWTDETRDAFHKEVKRLQRYAPNTPDYAVQYAYLDTFLNLPWLECDDSDFEIDNVAAKLDADHYGLEKVKERIVEHTAVLKLRHDMKAPILCLYGPPGTGKTSLGKSVAEALGRKYMRVSLGGVHDESEIRGHRRTYLGAMPGRIITALQKCGTSDPVIVLDEIDKLGADIKGDPSSALLEVLDPEQNSRFHDNYIDHDYDLSRVLFIATANDLSTISGPLLDRMELIEIGGYVEDEKIEIAQRYLVPKNLELHGFARDDMKFTREALHEIIEFYTRESGVRRLEKKIAAVIRKQAVRKASGKEFLRTVNVADVRECLGSQEVFPDQYENNDIAGIVTGLAWTSAGGEILFIESTVTEATDSKLTLTGNLGNVMKESAMLALEYLKSHAQQFGLDAAKLDKSHVHVHVPEGAVPKDGPSAGITIATSIASAFTRRKVKDKIAMTGEITLRGKVLPVGGIKEKILAAKRAGIREIVLSGQNRRDVEEIKAEYIESLQFHFVSSVSEVLEVALLDELAE